jgi:hypothetical protein
MAPDRRGPPPRGNAGRPRSEPVGTGSSARIGLLVPPVYLAAPLVCYGTARYLTARSQLSPFVPDGAVIEAATAFANSMEWIARWPGIVRQIGTLVFIADENRHIGAGVFQEILDARFHGVPVLYLDGRGAFHPCHALSFRFRRAPDPLRIATVRLARER